MVNADVWYAQAAQVLSFLHENGLSMSGQEDIMSLSSSGGSNSMRAPLSSIDWTQQQQPVTGSQDATQTNIQSPMARIVLIRQPNSHVFQNRTIFLEPGKEVKIGRSVARARVNDNNGIFDCKVLSRNHAIVWYTADGSFYVKDMGSSNGTFVNNQRLSQSNVQSEACQLYSGDCIQFGVDVVENATSKDNKVQTHGCILALLKLYLPDGTEAKQNPNMTGGGSHIMPEDLCRLSQFIQEAVQREQYLESKLLKLQKSMEVTRKNSENNWQAMIDEDRLLSRIDILENKLQYFQKNISENKLRDEVIKLQEDKLVYQNSAKKALRKVYADRMEALHKLATLERALCSSEDEASLLREQLLKNQQAMQEMTSRLSTAETSCAELQEKCKKMDVKDKENEIESKLQYEQLERLNTEKEFARSEYVALVNENENLKSRLMNFEIQQNGAKLIENLNNSDNGSDKSSKNILLKWLKNSDINNKEGSESIMNAICNEPEENSELNDAEKMNRAIFKNLVEIMDKFMLLEDNEKNTSDENNLQLSDADSSKTDVSIENDGNQNINTTVIISTADKYKERGVIIRDIIDQLKLTCVEVMRQFSEIRNKPDENVTEGPSKELVDVMESKLGTIELELQSLQDELEKRPTFEVYQEKIKLSEALLADLMVARKESEEIRVEFEKLETLNKAITVEMIALKQKRESVANVSLQTDVQPLLDHRKVQTTREELSEKESQTTLDKSWTDHSSIEEVAAVKEAKTVTHEHKLLDGDDEQNNIDIKLITDPQVQQVEELIIFKEKCEQLTQENLHLKSELSKLSLNSAAGSHQTTWFIYIVVASLIAMTGYFISPFL